MSTAVTTTVRPPATRRVDPRQIVLDVRAHDLEVDLDSIPMLTDDVGDHRGSGRSLTIAGAAIVIAAFAVVPMLGPRGAEPSDGGSAAPSADIRTLHPRLGSPTHLVPVTSGAPSGIPHRSRA